MSQQPEESELDVQLQEQLDALVQRVIKGDSKALDELAETIRTSTSSMTAVPKPLKYLRESFGTLEEAYNKSHKKELADVLSVIGTTVKSGDALKYRLLAGNGHSAARWGHEYVRHLALEIGTEFRRRSEEEEDTAELGALSREIVPSLLQDNSEADAVDLLLEVELVAALPEYVDKQTFSRVCRYVVACVPFLDPGDVSECLQTAYQIYYTFGALPEALVLAIRLDSPELVRKVFDAAQDDATKIQLGLLIGRQKQSYGVECAVAQEAITNQKLTEFYQYLVKELNVAEPKKPEDILRSQYDSKLGSAALEPSKQNLATSFVNALVHTGYGNDSLVLNDLDDSSWIYRTSGVGMQCAVASIGLLHLWDVNAGLPILDRYLYSSEEHVKAGALLGVGVLSTGVHDEVDPAMALLGEHLDNSSSNLRSAALMGLALAYAGTCRSDIAELLVPLVTDDNLPMEASSLAALALGLVFVGSANGDCIGAIMQALLERPAAHLSDKWSRFMALGLALLFIGKPQDTEETLETLKALDHPVRDVVETLVTICSYCGSGNVLQIQKLLRECSTRPYEDETDSEDEEDDEDELNLRPEPADEIMRDEQELLSEGDADAADAAGAAGAEGEGEGEGEESPEDKEKRREERRESTKVKAYCVLGIAIIAMGEQVGQEMVLRHFGHLMHYGDASIRRAVPLALGLISASNPEIKVYDTLSRYSHDSDLEVAINAVFAMGLVGAGTNNARIAQLLRQLAAYYSRDPDTLFMVRMAQGLVHLGKGVLSVSPFHTERQVLSAPALGGLLIVSVALLSPKSFVLSQSPGLMYFLTPAIHPRMLVTVDENMEPIKVSVRVGRAVDVVGQAGRPKTITGWVTHTTPVLLAYGERAELEDDEYIALGAALEGVAILKKNPQRE